VARTSADYLVLDIETIPDTSRWTPAEGQEAAFPPSWAHRVVAIGGMWLDHRYQLRKATVRVEVGDDAHERALIEAWSDEVGDARPVLVTYNGRRFDLNVLALRALAHGIPLGWYYREAALRDRDNEERHLDLCDALADHGAARSSSLDALAKLIGLPGKHGLGPAWTGSPRPGSAAEGQRGVIDGLQVAGMHARGEHAAIGGYCLSDVAQTALLMLRYRVLQGRLELPAYRTAARALLDGLAKDGRFAELIAHVDLPRLLIS
jgi:hypothetical protein